MLSRESRLAVVVIVAAAAGVALAKVPLSSAALPFRQTASYPVWVFLVAVVCGLCPIVWSHGRGALTQLATRRSVMREALWYGACAAAVIVAYEIVVPVFVIHGPSPLPYIKVRFVAIYVAVALAAAPGVLAMRRIGDISLCGDGQAADLVAWRAILQSQLAGLGTLVVFGTLTTAAFRNATLEVPKARPADFPPEYVLLFGAGLTVILALAYVPPSERLRRRAQAVVDEMFPVPNHFDGDWQEQLQQRRDLSAALRTDETSRNSIQNALIIAGPLISTALALLISTH